MKRSPINRGKPPKRKKPLSQRTSHDYRDARGNKHRAEPPDYLLVKKFVHERAGGRCEANWEGVCPPGPHAGQHVHHIILRSQGGPGEAWNLMLLCHVVHRHAHDVDRAGAEARGIIRSGFSGR